MRRLIPALLVVLALGLALLPAPTAARPRIDAVPGEVLVRLHPTLSLTQRGAALSVRGPATASGRLDRQLAALGAHKLRPLGENTYQISLRPNSDPLAAVARLSPLAGVIYAVPNYERRLLRVPNDSAFDQQWGLRNVQAPEAWSITTGGPIVVAVLDTGVDDGHPDLEGQVLRGFNAVTGSNDAGDDNGHGTAVSGLIAAKSDNGRGIAGLCWGCKILPVKVLRASGGGTDGDVALGIRWAADNGARIINMSLGGSQDSPAIRDAVAYAAARGILLVAASGNEKQDGNAPSYPAAYPEVLAVGATGNSDVITGFSNTGPYVDLSAPGVGLWTTLPGGGYGPPNGTSFSSPYAAAAAALVLTLRPDLGYFDVSCVLETSADDKGAPGKDEEYGWGRLNVLKAVQLAPQYGGCALNTPPANPEPPPPSGTVPPPPSTGVPPAFAPIPPFASSAERAYFPETGHSLGGGFKRYWDTHGGLPIFGFPISEEFTETGSDGQPYTVQYFERHRFEFHPQNAPPYDVQLSRIGDDILRQQGRDWFTFPKTGPVSGCVYFEQTGQSVCEPFLSYWRSNGLEFDGRPGKSYAESLALFGQPLSPPQTEEVAPGVFLTVQWFERARFENHDGRVLLGLLGNELTRARGWR